MGPRGVEPRRRELQSRVLPLNYGPYRKIKQWLFFKVVVKKKSKSEIGQLL